MFMRVHRGYSVLALFLAVLAFVTVQDSRAQSQDTASLTGVVTDASGAVIAGANIELTNPATGQVFKAVSNSSGSYTIANVPPGPGYKETVSREGFETTVLTGLYLNVGQTRTQSVKLNVGSISQTVAVSAANETETLDTTDASLGNNFQVQYLNALPIALRD